MADLKTSRRRPIIKNSILQRRTWQVLLRRSFPKLVLLAHPPRIRALEVQTRGKDHLIQRELHRLACHFLVREHGVESFERRAHGCKLRSVPSWTDFCGHQVRFDHRRADGVDGDVVFGVDRRERADQADEGVFGGAVHWYAVVGIETDSA